MYFKIEDKESNLYKDVMLFIHKRRSMEIDNLDKARNIIEKLTGLESNQYDLLISRGGFWLIPWPSGIQMKNDTPIPKGFRYNKGQGCICPNGVTKLGRQLNRFFGALPNIRYRLILDLFKVKDKFLPRFSLPYLEEIKGVIIVRIDSQYEPESTDYFIEITESEFNKIYNSAK